jgi:hypothetical protein
VYPVADGITAPTSKTVGVEDNGPVAFGNTLASTGLEPTDNGRKAGNNPESETVSQILFVIPENTETLTYTITGGSSTGTAQASFDAGTRTYLISSTIISSVSDLATLTQAQREEAEEDIRATLATFQVEIGPEHNDANGKIAVTVTTLDVNLGKYATKDVDLDHDIVIQAVADTPSIFVHDADPVSEDGNNVPLYINVTRSDDDDNSETVSVRITVPKDPSQVIGTIVGITPETVTLVEQDDGVYLITVEGPTPAARQENINSFVADGGLAFNPRTNWAGNSTLKVEVISTEGADGSELANGGQYGGNDSTSKTDD